MDAVGCLWSLIWMTPRRASRETLWFQIQATHPSAPKASALVAWRLPLRITACIFVPTHHYPRTFPGDGVPVSGRGASECRPGGGNLPAAAEARTREPAAQTVPNVNRPEGHAQKGAGPSAS